MPRTSLSWKILLGIMPPLLIALAVSVIVQNRAQEDEMMAQAQESASTYADLIRESLVSMMVHSQEIDTSYISRVRTLRSFDHLEILVNDLRLREELLSDERIASVRSKVRSAPSSDTLRARVIRTGQPVFFRAGDHFRALIPFTATKTCQKCHAVPLDHTLGAADMRFSLTRFTHAAEDNWQRSVIIFLLFTVVAVGVAVVVFRRAVSRPVQHLVEATTAIRQGDLSAGPARPPDAERVDELGVLADHFEEMRRSLADKIDRLDRANQELLQRNADLEDALARLRQTQEELVRSERLAATGRMAAQLSHEINNPIHNTRSLLESSLRRMEGTSKEFELVSLAAEEVNRMADLTRQLLDVYRGTVAEFVPEDVDLVDLVREVERAHRDSFAASGIRLTVSTDGAVPRVRGVKDKLAQVLLNLLLNARDAMPGGGDATVAVRGDTGSVLLTVRDTGTGIAPEHMGQIFDAFFTTKGEVSGVGLGLAVSYGIIQQHHGTITVESVPGEGARFLVRLPAATPSGGPHA